MSVEILHPGGGIPRLSRGVKDKRMQRMESACGREECMALVGRVFGGGESAAGGRILGAALQAMRVIYGVMRRLKAKHLLFSPKAEGIFAKDRAIILTADFRRAILTTL